MGESGFNDRELDVTSILWRLGSFVDGKRVPNDVLKTLDAERIASVNRCEMKWGRRPTRGRPHSRPDARPRRR